MAGRISADSYDTTAHQKMWELLRKKIAEYFWGLPAPETPETALERIDDLKGLLFSQGLMGSRARLPEHYCYACDYAARKLKAAVEASRRPGEGYKTYDDKERCGYCPVAQWGSRFKCTTRPEKDINSNGGLVWQLAKACVERKFATAELLCEQIRDIKLSPNIDIDYSFLKY